MVQYRRNFVAGGTYFFTVALNNRQSTILVDYVDLLRSSFQHVKQKHPFITEAMVVLPDHLHAIWTLPPGDIAYPKSWQLFKARFTRLVRKSGLEIGKNARGEYSLWQRRYWEHTIRDPEDLVRHIDYIHYNPIKHGYVVCAADWPYSSFHRHVENGLLPRDWCGKGIDIQGVGHE